MGKIRVNDLARELEVKSRAVLDYLLELGIEDKKSHSSAIDDDVAEKVRAHFKAESGSQPEAPPSARAKAAQPPASPRVASAPAAPEARKSAEARPAAGSLTRTLAEIKAEARKAVAPAVHPAAPPEKAPAKIAARPSPAAAAGPVSPPAAPAPAAKLPGAKPGAPSIAARPIAKAAAPSAAGVPSKAAEEVAVAKSLKAPRGARGLASNQPIYPSAALLKTLPTRGPGPRRPGEPRPMHPTSSRPAAAGESPGVAAGGVPALRPPLPRRGGLPQRAGGTRMAPPRPVPIEEVPITRKITISEGISVKELSGKLEVRAKDVIKRLLDKGLFATINQTLDSQTSSEIARGFGAETAVVTYEEEVLKEVEEADRPEDLEGRAPVVTVMGHVDHGKTSLLDAIRETSVAAREAGGITQHIGAYEVEAHSRKIVFLDTPGHEAFTLMRARGAKVTDIVVLVVAADDGVMPQTVEAINHARAAKVPIVVTINKIDRPDAQAERVKKQLADLGLVPEAWGGDTVTVEVSAKQKTNLGLLLEMILLVADMQTLKANPKRLASGTVLEAKLDRGRGPVATILVKNGNLNIGDSFIVGAIFGKVRAMFDHRGHPVETAGPATPVEVLGLEDVPQVGDRMQVIEDTLKARQIALHRQAKLREAALAKSARLTLEHLHEQLAAGDVKELPIVLKADVQGSAEVLADALTKLSTEKVKVKVIHSGVGAVTETDVLLASASNAVIVGFSVRPERKASELAQLENVDIRLHTVIYEVVEEIKKAMVGLLAVAYKEVSLGRAEVRDTFRIPKVGTVAGCYVQDGKITRESRVRVLRDSVVINETRVRSLRRFKEDVAEVRTGLECGLALENFNDIKVGDVIEAFVTEKVAEAVTA